MTNFVFSFSHSTASIC